MKVDPDQAELGTSTVQMKEDPPQLRPCPVCGAQPYYFDTDEGCVIGCSCGTRIEGETREDIVEPWNTRTLLAIGFCPTNSR